MDAAVVSNDSSTAASSNISRTHGALETPADSSIRPNQTPSLTSEENSLTSFPSLSPSWENSPQASRNGPLSSTAVRARAPSNSSNAIPSSFQGLFSPSDSTLDRSALFFDTPQNTREIPGTLHLQSDRNVEHLISRIGAVTLVKQLSQDLAHRDAHVTLVQRKAEARETALRKMLRACHVSNLDIESRLRDLERPATSKSQAGFDVNSSRQSGSYSTGVAATANIGDHVTTAIEDVIDEHDLDRTVRASNRGLVLDTKAATAKGWKDLFRPSSGTTRPTYVTVNSSNSLAKKRNVSVATDPDALIPHGGLPVLSRSSSLASGIPVADAASPRSMQASTEASESETPSKSVASWALKLVAGNSQPDKSIKTQQSKRGSSVSQKQTVNDRSTQTKDKHSTYATLRKITTSQGPSPRTSVSAGQDTLAKVRAAISKSSLVGTQEPSIADSQTGAFDGAETNLGPVEMDTILPEDTRPPTLTQFGNNSSKPEFLTDSFGFIYDQRRQRMKRQASIGLPQDKNGDHLEPLRGHNRSAISTEFDNEDLVSVDSRDDLSRITSRRDLASPVESSRRQDPTKRWQDYLKLSKLSVFQTELLSHTPAPAPITDITVADSDESDPQKPHIHISTRGSEPASGQLASISPSMATSHNAELSTTSTSRPVSPGPTSENEVDPVKALVDHLADIHEASQREKMFKWNEFLRKVRADRERDISSKSGLDSRTRDKTMPETQIGDGEIVGVAGLGVRGKVGRAKGNEFRNLVLAGIPVAFRAKIWAECSGAVALRTPGYYEELANSTFVDNVVEQQIQMDITRTLTDNIYYRRGVGIEKLKEVLLAYARHNPVIGYCQGMNLITANLLLIMPAAEDAFWVLASMIDNILPEKYFDSSLLTSRADQVVLRQYVSEILPQLSEHLDNLNIELEALTFQWFLSIFTDCLSAEALFRVWDVVLCLTEGASFLFQVALALLKLNEKPLLKCDNPAEVYGYINQGMTDHAISIDNLIRASDGLKKEVRTEEILKRRKEAVDLEIEASKQRDAIRKTKGKAKAYAGSATSLISSELLSSSQELAQGRITAADDVSRQRGGKLVREDSRAEYDHEARQALGELEVKTPMPIDEEALWRG